MAKRLFDVLLSSLGLLVLAPVLLLIALCVKLDSPGPVMFRQERVGRGGAIFRIHKFRSMRVSTSGSLITSSTDDRITPVGHFLRSSKLDELPQLIDVFSGQMSLVGPRPEVQRYVDQWPRDAREKILSVRPGISDPAAIAYRHEQEELSSVADPEKHYVEVILPRKVKMYVDYVENRNFVGDLAIILRTFAAIVR